MKLNAFQHLVREHYCDGEFAEVETTQQVRDAGDGLFTFLMDEAHEADDMGHFHSMLDTAIRQIQEVKQKL